MVFTDMLRFFGLRYKVHKCRTATHNPQGWIQIRDIKLPQVGIGLTHLLTTTYKFVCFDSTCLADIK